MNNYSPDQLAFIHKLEQLAGYVDQPADQESRELMSEIQDEFENQKRAAAREGLENDGRLTVGDVLTAGAEVGQDFPKAQIGCEVFASVFFVEKVQNAPNN